MTTTAAFDEGSGPRCILGCGRPVHARGLCKTCYALHYRHGDLDEYALGRELKGQPCSVPSCRYRARYRGLCKRHRRELGLPVGARRGRVPSVLVTCCTEGCGERAVAKGLCERHYNTAYVRERRRRMREARACQVST